MQRRNFIKSMVAAGASAAVGQRAHAVPQGWREFEITYVITLKDAVCRRGYGYRCRRMRSTISAS